MNNNEKFLKSDVLCKKNCKVMVMKIYVKEQITHLVNLETKVCYALWTGEMLPILHKVVPRKICLAIQVQK